MMILMNALFLCMITVFLYNFSTRRSKGKIIISYLLTLVLTSFIISPFFSWLHIFIYFIILELHVLYILGKQPTKSLPLFMLPIVYAGVMLITSLLVGMMTGKQRLLLIVLVFCFINLLLLLLFMGCMKWLKDDQKTVYMNMLVYFPIFFIFELYCMEKSVMCKIHDLTLFVCVLGIMLSNFIVLFILYKILVFEDCEAELTLSQHREDALLMKYDSMKQHYESQFALVHQLLHQCTILQDDMRKHDYKHLETTLNQVSEDVFTQFNLLYSNSAILNYAIVEHMDQIKQSDIYIKSVMEYNDFSFLSLSTQTALFTYLLELAIDEVKKVDHPRMIVWKTKKLEDTCLLQCSFSANEIMNEEELQKQIDAILFDVTVTTTISYDRDTKMMKIFFVFQNASYA